MTAEEVKVDYYSPKNEWTKYKNGNGSFYDTSSVVKKTLTFKIETPEDKEVMFRKIYHLNNELRYCNGSYYKFQDAKYDNEYYHVFRPRYNTMRIFMVTV